VLIAMGDYLDQKILDLKSQYFHLVCPKVSYNEKNIYMREAIVVDGHV
jgi:hypothetical protein